MSLVLTRAYKVVLNEIYFVVCTMSLSANNSVVYIQVNTDWLPDDKFADYSYLLTAKDNHLPRLFINGANNTPLIMPFDLVKGQIYPQ